MVRREVILKTRPNNSSIEAQVITLFQNYQLKFPPFLKLFLETFDISHEYVRSEYYLDDNGDLFQIGGIGYPQKYMHHFEDFSSFENIYRNYGDFLEKKIIKEKKFWIIGSGAEKLICVSTESSTEDKVFKIEDFYYTIEEWEENIFDFTNNFVSGNFEGFIEFDKLIEFWGDNYWKQKDKLEIEYNNSGRTTQPIPRLGFTFIGVRPKEDEDQIKEILKLMDLPFRVNTFLTYFKFEGKKGLKTFRIYDKSKDQFIEFETIQYAPRQLNGKSIIIEEMYIDEKLLDAIESFKSFNSDFLEIGKTQSGLRIYLGLSGKVSEEIWLSTVTPQYKNKDSPIKLADDIFKFIRGFEPIYKEEYFNKIYRNWAEDFWRIQI